MKITFLPLVALVVACATAPACVNAPPPQASSRAPGFPAEKLELIDRAAAKWNTVLRQPIDLTSWTFREETTREMEKNGWGAMTAYGPHIIYFRPTLAPESFYKLALHELGHTLGIHHQAAGGVTAATPRVTEFNEVDLEACREVGACPLTPVDLAKCQFQGACP